MRLFLQVLILVQTICKDDKNTACKERVNGMTYHVGTFMEIDHELISTVILLLPLMQEGLLSVTSESIAKSMVYHLLFSQACLGKSAVR